MVAVAFERLDEEMGLAAGEDPGTLATAEVHLPADINWEMLDKSKFFFLGAGLFSTVSAALYPAVVLKTRLQVSPSAAAAASCLRAAAAILRHEGPRGFYRGFGTSIAGTVPARALYMGALEVTRSGVGTAAARLGASEPASAAIASAAAGVSAAMAAQVVWTPIDVVTQRLMVQGGGRGGAAARYRGGVDAFRKILMVDGLRGLYRGFGVSILTYAPSSAVWWASYSLSQRVIWGGVGCCLCSSGGEGLTPGYGAVSAVQAASAAVAGGVSAVTTMPLDTIKTRMQVVEGEEGKSVWRTVRALVREGGWAACYRGLGPRWASMSMSAVTMVTTYELLKRLSAKTETGTTPPASTRQRDERKMS
ncbi:hypothetical protein Taro_011666 [Colocasia esculenta]|uniref:Mitochondrial carrier protein n=1 Tax=Colocasia esculenta TaxID=4460 RepID=A0A843U6H7_COLES|nr:hypothetical protein [Colocasia esculenta]